MTEEQPEPPIGEDPVTNADSETPELEAPTLNRADRRAQAKNKKGGSANSRFGSGFGNNNSGFGEHGGSAPNKTRLPRTGHK